MLQKVTGLLSIEFLTPVCVPVCRILLPRVQDVAKVVECPMLIRRVFVVRSELLFGSIKCGDEVVLPLPPFSL